MRWRSTFWLMGAAAALFGYIWFFERHQPTTDERNAPQPLLSGFRWKEIDSVQVHRTNAFVVLAHRTNNSWRCFAPVSYPAQSAAIESLLNVAAGLTRDFLVAEALPPPGAPASSRYGLDSPSAVLTLVQGKLRAELRLGDRTASKEQVYAQLAGAPGVYAVPASLLDAIPSAFHEWRDPALAEWATLAFDRVSVSNSTRGFTLAFDRTNLFSLVKPFEARADNERVNRLLRELYSAQVTSFVNDLPGSELDLYGLQPPLLELGIGHGTNLLASIHFGISPTNDPSVVYARLSGHGNVVLTSRDIFDALQISYLDLRDTRLVPFQLEAAESLEVKGPEGFSVRRQGTNEWVIQPGGALADVQLMREVLSDISRLRIVEFAKDFVTDFTPFALSPPAYSWIVRGGGGGVQGSAGTNRVLAHVDLGGMVDQKVFARRPDESSVYGIALADAMKLPEAPWKLRNRSIWSFATNEVAGVTVEQDGKKLQLRRTAEGAWGVVDGPPRHLIPNTFALEETVHRLGRLRASVWTARGDTNRAALGFGPGGHRITIDLKREAAPRTLAVEFGGRAPSRYTYAEVKLDGDAWYFEFPLDIYFAVLRDLSITKTLLQ